MKNIFLLTGFILCISKPLFSQTISTYEGNKYENGVTQVWTTDDGKTIYTLSESMTSTILYKHINGKVSKTKEFPNKTKEGKLKVKVNYQFFQLGGDFYCLVQGYAKKNFPSASLKKLNPQDLSLEDTKIDPDPIAVKMGRYPSLMQVISSPNKQYFSLIYGQTYLQTYNTQLELVNELKELESNLEFYYKNMALTNSGKLIILLNRTTRFRETYNFGTPPSPALYDAAIWVFTDNDILKIELKEEENLVRDYAITENVDGDIAAVGYIGEPIDVFKIKALNNAKSLDSKKVIFHLFDGKTGDIKESNSLSFEGEWEFLRTDKLVYLEKKELYAFVGIEIKEIKKSGDNNEYYSVYEHNNIQVLLIDQSGELVSEAKLIHKVTDDPYGKIRNIDGLVVTDNEEQLFVASNGSKDAKWDEEKLKIKENKYSGAVIHTVDSDGNVETYAMEKETGEDDVANTVSWYVSPRGAILMRTIYEDPMLILFSPK